MTPAEEMDDIITQPPRSGYLPGIEQRKNMIKSIGPELNAALEQRLLLDKVQKCLQNIVNIFANKQNVYIFNAIIEDSPFKIDDNWQVVKRSLDGPPAE